MPEHATNMCETLSSVPGTGDWEGGWFQKELGVGYTPTIPSVRRLRRDDREFKASVGYLARVYLKQRANK